MYYQCLECGASFDASCTPVKCPHCTSGRGFGVIRIINSDASELSYSEHIKSLREHYLTSPPQGMCRKEISRMTDRELEDMDDILSE